MTTLVSKGAEKNASSNKLQIMDMGILDNLTM